MSTADIMQQLARVVDRPLNNDPSASRIGFVILAFPRDKGAQMANYVSNCGRADTITAMKEVAARLEAKGGAL